MTRFRNAYIKCADCIGPQTCWGVEAINDSMLPRHRLQCYLAAMAILGYTEGMPEKVLELAKEAKKRK